MDGETNLSSVFSLISDSVLRNLGDSVIGLPRPFRPFPSSLSINADPSTASCHSQGSAIKCTFRPPLFFPAFLSSTLRVPTSSKTHTTLRNAFSGSPDFSLVRFVRPTLVTLLGGRPLWFLFLFPSYTSPFTFLFFSLSCLVSGLVRHF